MPITLLPQRRINPYARVHLCFLAVFLFSAFLTAHEALELKNNYEQRQSAQLAEIQKALDSQFRRAWTNSTTTRRCLTMR